MNADKMKHSDKANLVSERNDVYQIVTDRIVELLEKGTVPWHKAWAQGEEFPINLVSKKPYRGINVWMLGAMAYGSPYWVSFKQAKELGGNVKKGEKASIAVFWKWLEVDDKESGEKKRIPFLRYYNVFNVEQTEGVEYPKPEPRNPQFNPIESAERIVSNMPKRPEIKHGEARAYYRPSTDIVNMPAKESFDGEAEYYSTLLHELAHATGHESRLGRFKAENEGDSRFGSSSYAKEELVAEMSASYLSAFAGILHRTVDNSAAYIAAWLERLKNDRKLVVYAAAQAHKASDYILGLKPEIAEPVAQGSDEVKAGGRVNVLTLAGGKG